MKKLALTLVLGLVALSASAQWGIGGRVGSGFEAVGQYTFSNDNYVEARFGANWATASGVGVCADFSVLYNWNIATMDWTPRAGTWFFDLGAGINVGGKGHYAYVGPQLGTKFGFEFSSIPLRLAFDWSPAFGPEIWHWKNFPNHTEFNGWGLANMGVSCVYSF